MKENEKRPAGMQSLRGEKSLGQRNKDKINISDRQRSVLNLLRQGRYSATDISIILGYSDPRSYIKTLRDKGFNIVDEWVDGKDTRYKLYWL